MGHKDLAVAQFDALTALYERWGFADEPGYGKHAHGKLPMNPFARVTFQHTRGDGVFYIIPNSDIWHTTTISRSNVSADATGLIESLALFFASEDWREKSEGSIHRMKAIQDALKS